MNFLSTFVFAILAFFSLVNAAPIALGADSLSTRDVFVPPVLLPNSHSVWKVGSKQTVTWDVRDAPKQITNGQAQVILVTNGKLDYEHPLAKGIDVLKGKAQITVPKVAPGKNYQILVFGDSGNTGEFFTITN
ncbi:hypothetical protein BDN70DRAFT_868583 [Pholiota conissans]|uniref:Yeast cell wall synthesis Kre9/Knh1-like N-terminal domain-containing protein n=1 Tax=Pholiota conissans TaxID=109636 RepID=A0A9P6CU45_9AGAR|nr:hypothetical protein BDN70DRAFT_868583 [Pholiota conissans]